MPNKKQKRSKQSAELDSIYILKLVIYLIVGSFWVKIVQGESLQIPVPIGPVLGLWFASRDHFRIDRKIEYAILLMSALVGFWAPLGLFIYM
jgi:hypothetical protein